MAKQVVDVSERSPYAAKANSPPPPPPPPPLSRSVPLAAVTTSFIQLATTTFIANLIATAYAYDPTTCCMKRARQFVVELDYSPWTVCSAGVVDPWNQSPRPHVTADLAWCLQACPGIVASGLDQWLHPLAQWFAPYTTLLFLCPIGDGEEEDAEEGVLHMVLNYVLNFLGRKVIPTDKTEDKIFKRHNFARRLLEWANILADPASAIWGSLAQLNMDLWIVNRLRRGHKRADYSRLPEHREDEETAGPTVLTGNGDIDWYDKQMLGVVVMAGQTAMDKSLGRSLTKELIIEGLRTAVIVVYPPLELGETQSPSTSPPQSILALQKALSEAKNDTLTLGNISEEALRELASSVGDLMMGRIDLADFLNSVDDTLSTASIHPQKTALRDAIHTVVQALETRRAHPRTILSPSSTPFNPYPYEDSPFTINLCKSIQTILEARMTFITAIALPVVIHFATTAQVFYESYQKLGDNQTAHGLAYGALYSWLLLVAVIGNCAVASANAGLIKQQIKKIFTLSGIRVPLRNRYPNAVEWECWLTDIGMPTGLRDRMEKARKENPNMNFEADKFAFENFYGKYLLGQLVGWVAVAFFCGCAATISYTTPTVGWGCRSFNHLLYAILSLVVALLQVWKHKVERIDLKEDAKAKMIAEKAVVAANLIPVEKAAHGDHQTEEIQDANARTGNATENKIAPSPPPWLEHRPHPKRSAVTRLIRTLYIIFTTLNFAALIVGTILNFAGVYNSCRCKHIFGPADHPLELAGNTQLCLDMARRFWNSTGYVAYLVAWCVCAAAVVVRKVLQSRLGVEFPGEDDETAKNSRNQQMEDAIMSTGRVMWGFAQKDAAGPIGYAEDLGRML